MTAALRAAILAATDAVDAARTELGELDGVAGDGDHGMTMSIAARNVRRRLPTLADDTSAADLLRATGAAIAGVGGAIGPIYAGALGAAAGAIEAAPGAGATSDVAALRGAAEAAEAAIVGLGHAAPGDKTVLDALHPLVESLRDSEARGLPFAEALAAAAHAADEGVAATADMIARIGRAARLGERSRGRPDAGARSFAVIVRALVDATDASERSGGAG